MCLPSRAYKSSVCPFNNEVAGEGGMEDYLGVISPTAWLQLNYLKAS